MLADVANFNFFRLSVESQVDSSIISVVSVMHEKLRFAVVRTEAPHFSQFWIGSDS